MVTKLTLSIDERTVKKAKQIARANGTSVSAMFSQFVQSISDERRTSAKIGPLTRKLSGIIQIPPDREYKELVTDALMEKYGMSE